MTEDGGRWLWSGGAELPEVRSVLRSGRPESGGQVLTGAHVTAPEYICDRYPEELRDVSGICTYRDLRRESGMKRSGNTGILVFGMASGCAGGVFFSIIFRRETILCVRSVKENSI